MKASKLGKGWTHVDIRGGWFNGLGLKTGRRQVSRPGAVRSDGGGGGNVAPSRNLRRGEAKS